MKYNISKLGLYSITAALLMAGCKNSSNGGFETDAATGVQYHFFKQSKSGNKTNMGDIVRVILVNKTDKDSVLFNSAKQGGDSLGAIRVQLKKIFNGCLEQGIAMMSVGDSAAFRVSADSLVMKNSREPHPKMPPFLHAGSYLTFDIKLLSFETEKQATEEREQAMMKQRQEMQQLEAAEPARIAKYISDNKIKAKPSADGLYFISRGGKSGKSITDGDSVVVKYKGTLLDGTVFDQSDRGPGHTTISFNYSKDMHMIQGWVEALGTMHEGETATILLPSALAYGERPPSPSIPPFSPLIFDIQIVKVISHK